jgi:hypothetical protein
MQLHRSRSGSETTVVCTTEDVANFARMWPCFGEPRPITFVFDGRGDLTEIIGNEAGLDERGLLILSEDAKAFACERLSL